MRALIGIIAVLLGGLALSFYLLREGTPAPAAERPFSVVDFLSGEESLEGYARVQGPRPFAFPADHGPHPQYRHEWWYLTGNLTAAEGQHFGYQVTFFRANVEPEPRRRDSAWAGNQIYMAHFALTDTQGREFHHFERFSRAAPGLAGAEARPFRVWLEDWRLEGVGADLLPLRVELAAGDVAIDLELSSAKPVVLQGEQGYSRKGPRPDNATHYYSLTRLLSRGRISLGAESFAVAGESWLDREWGTSALSAEQQGWDWFSLQLDDGRELMFYRLRLADGGTDLFSHGVLVEADGSSRRLALSDVELSVQGHWRSPADGTRYPLRWRLAVPDEGIELSLEPRLEDQELRGAFRYWEGAVRVRGSQGERPLAGHGYMELTGY